MNNKNKCPVCGEGVLHEKVEYEYVEYGGKIHNSPLYFSECDICGSETASIEQVKKNKSVMETLRNSCN